MVRRYETDDVEGFSGTATRRLQPSSHLAPRPKAIFRRVVNTTAVNHFRPADKELLERYCEVQALAEIAAENLFSTTSVGDTAEKDAASRFSHWFSVHTVASRTANSLASRLRLTVSARSPKAAKTRAAKQSYYDLMREAREAEGSSYGDVGPDGGRH
jgi:phage terminase small subunit